mmetsp:Transcript_38046/g.83544  ORF Transcript_38046/g.83544 Transcript_38046/m.83544 type:complete len:443 (-) Transcript_38046:98-1426(-)
MMDACRDQQVTGSLDELCAFESPLLDPVVPAGATGRVMLLQASSDLSEEDIFNLKCCISQEMDDMIYANPPLLRQPVLLSIHQNDGESSALSNDDGIVERLATSIQNEVKEYEMNASLPYNPDSPPAKDYVPALHVEVDGAQVADPTITDGTTFWDTSTVLVFDDLVTDDLRRRLLDVVLGRNDSTSSIPAWDDAKNGPDPRRWVRGGLLDVPTDEQMEPSATDSEDGSCWGLKDEVISELCFEHHDAIQEFETILSDLFPQFTISRLPEAVLSASVSPLTANAATFGDHFDWHIDADPNMTPPSPWTDVYGRYPNRCRGKPRFMSCLIYVSDDWNEHEWGAPTRFVDVATDTAHDVEAKSGRVVIMDQDITHSVVAPREAAGRRPRYSLVWKLILHPKQQQHGGQDMTDLANKREWPEPILVGSAATEVEGETAGATSTTS